jgi:predicted RNA-binding Zn-ribbon protein involved in translation (DUF1610 family)
MGMVVTDAATLVPVERVRCLECGSTYVKRCGGNTLRRNPGCPQCGYVGWISAFVPFDGVPAPQRRGPR